jgi:NitT/TauT family transport system ATP-binding protein
MFGLKVRIARKTYRGADGEAELVALENLEFSTQEGQWVAIVGPSGSGKTTLLNIVSGLDRDVDGEVRFGPPGSAVGYVFQTPRLMPWLNVLDNVRLGLPERAPPDAAIAMLKEMEIAEFLDAYPNRLSGGMQRRVALARSFVAEPKLMLLDEPFLSLDAPTQLRMRRLLVKLWSRHPATVLFVTHDLTEALMLADRVLFFSERPGRIILDFAIDLPRPREPESEELVWLKRSLLDRHPRLLSGSIKRQSPPPNG